MRVELHHPLAPRFPRGQVRRRPLADRVCEFYQAQARMWRGPLAQVLAINHGDDLGVEFRMLKYVGDGAGQPFFAAGWDKNA